MNSMIQVKKKRMKENNLTYWEHLEDLRKRIILCIFIWLFFSIISFLVTDKLLYFLTIIVRNVNISFNYFKPYEKLAVYFKVALLSGALITFPFILVELSIFIFPALKEGERRIFFIGLISVFISFLAGLLFAYFILIPMAVRFFVEFAKNDPYKSLWSISSYVNLCFSLLIGCGILFELPVVIFILTKINLINIETLAKHRKYVILIIAILSAVFSPPDVLSMFLLGLPLYLLFELSIFFGKFIKK